MFDDTLLDLDFSCEPEPQVNYAGILCDSEGNEIGIYEYFEPDYSDSEY